MNNIRYRKHPRVHQKAQEEENNHDENTLSMSAVTAVGILAAIFVKGVFWGYILRKSIRH